MLKEIAKKYYFEQNYNCAESVMRAANEYYDLQLGNRDMIMMGAFGGGIQCGSTCGALLGAAGTLSMKYIEQKAHESTDIRIVTNEMIRLFTERLSSTMCNEIKPKFFDSNGTRCFHTVETACDIIEEVIASYEEKKNL